MPVSKRPEGAERGSNSVPEGIPHERKGRGAECHWMARIGTCRTGYRVTRAEPPLHVSS
jgi:hypothetical protein